MKTIQLTELNLERGRLLIKLLIKHKLINFKKDKYFHFLFEPDLIIRTAYPKPIINYLKKVEVKYKIYPYPYTKKGYGESKKNKSFLPFIKEIMNLQSRIHLQVKGHKKKYYLANRLSHCYLNMGGYEYYDESKYYLSQSYSYMMAEHLSNGRLATLISAKLIKLLLKII